MALAALGLANAETSITDGLVSYWDYDARQKENPVDYTGGASRGWNGYYESGYTYMADGGVAGSGYAELTSASSYYTDSLNLGTTTGFSVSFAVKAWGGNNLINFKDGDNHAILKLRFDKLALELTGTVLGQESTLAETAVAYDSSQWHRMTMTCGTDGVVTLYADGVKYTTDIVWEGTFNKAQIASAYGQGSWNSTVHLDDVAFWNRELTEQEAMALSVDVAVVDTVLAASPVVPEPTTATLSLLALAGLAARRRRK